MKQLRLGLQAGLDVSWYSMVGFSSAQMEQVRLGLEAGIDVSGYADPFIDALEMEDMRLKLEGKSEGSGLDECRARKSFWDWKAV